MLPKSRLPWHHAFRWSVSASIVRTLRVKIWFVDLRADLLPAILKAPIFGDIEAGNSMKDCSGRSAWTARTRHQ